MSRQWGEGLPLFISPSPSLFVYKVVGMKKDQTLTLPSGVEIPFRVIRPEDAPALQRLHGRCGERTIYLRFFGPMKKLSDEKARYFASTDGVDHFGLVALDPQDQNEDRA